MSGYADPHATQTQPIAIGERGGPRDRGLSWHGGASSPLACPRAPVIGSMPVPSRLASNIPPLALPASYDVASARAGAVRTAKPGDPVGKWNYRVARALFALRQYDKCVLILDRAAACADCRADAKLLADCLATKKAAVAAQERRRDQALEKVM